MTRPLVRLSLAFALALAAAAAPAQHPDSAALLAGQTEAMRAFAHMDGVWRGPATLLMPDGTRRTITQTERIGPFLGGSIRVIEGRGYDDAGRVAFNAFGVISYDVAKRTYSMHSHAQGMRGDFAIVPSSDGYAWEIPAGPGATIRYVATIKDGELVEVGDRVVAGREPMRVFEMRLKRIGDTDWPAGGAISPR